ncbi:MAG: RrF2 family transcriptional regulator [Candidatus Methanomethylophilaceae archaeon]|nr:RrF2 family transcriptional regulator [Candidatus Methanomethylophilaceae archaeon]
MGFMVSTKGRYALRVMLDLAEGGGEEYVPLKDISDRQEIPHKYMEAIMSRLTKEGLVDAAHGKGGGYRLSRPAETYTVGEILTATEGDMVPVACLEGGFDCPRADVCKTLPVWRRLDKMIGDYLDSVRLVDLMDDAERDPRSLGRILAEPSQRPSS